MNLHFLLQFNLALHNTLPRLNKLGHLDICLMGHFLPFFEDHQAIILHNSPNTTFLYATTLVDISLVVSVCCTSKRNLAWHWRRSSHPLSMANKALLSCCYRMDPLEESANNVGAFRHQPSAESYLRSLASTTFTWVKMVLLHYGRLGLCQNKSEMTTII